MPTYQLQKDGTFVVKDYNQASPFSNFLPGIAGRWGLPLWVFYANRGQAVSSFGLENKDGAIAEFFPANKAYSLTPFFGFRTFVKNEKNIFYEPFAINKENPRIRQNMYISSGSFRISDRNPDFGLATAVKYFILPQEPVGALVRKVSFENNSGKTLNLEALDGLARFIPYGTANSFLKEMSRTVEAWMHTYLKNNCALSRLIADPADVAQTTYIRGANFNYSFIESEGKKSCPPLLIDPQKVFAADLSYSRPESFLAAKFAPGRGRPLRGKTPSAFSFLKLKIKPGQRADFYNLFGSAFETGEIKSLAAKIDTRFIEEKEKENDRIINKIKDSAFCLSSCGKFDNYLSSTYLDNVLRGGFPYKPDGPAGSKGIKPYYIFSRKHGDPERDYNYFNLSASYFSEGQGNYRDINQNRRMDLFFRPSLGAKNISCFLNLSQIDGYNPLVAKGEKLYFDTNTAKRVLKKYRIKKKKFLHLMAKGFYLGQFFRMLIPEDGAVDKEELVLDLIKEAKRRPEAQHADGYWIDHWRYNLDLIEAFIYFFPDKTKELFLDTVFTFFDDKYRIKPRRERYVLRKGRVYQGESIEADKKKAEIIKRREQNNNLLHNDTNKVYKTNLVEKMLVLILNKASSFDPDGLGLEMEADKPGWCDSVNGLPALFGSSLCETFELKRAASILQSFLQSRSKGLPSSLKACGDVYNFFIKLDKLVRSYNRDKSREKDFNYWDDSNKLKENFRRNSFYSLSSRKNNLSFARLNDFLKALIKKIDKGIERAKDKKTGLYPTYFTYSVTACKKSNYYPLPLRFCRHNLPLFLEGIVGALRVQKQKEIFKNTKRSPLFDKKLKMYRLNASLAGEPLDIGRSRVFPPGWLENESIWLHMEYKYLLELIKAGLYDEFFNEFANCAVCFQNPKIYGRNILENSSFLASSAHPDKSIHGKGFVARLTGATAELLNIWVLLSLGSKPFSVDKSGVLKFSPRPILDKKMFTKKAKRIAWQDKEIKIPKNTYSFGLFSKTLVIYHNPKKLNTYNKSCKVNNIVLTIGGAEKTFSREVKGDFAQLIRNQEVTQIDIHLG